MSEIRKAALARLRTQKGSGGSVSSMLGDIRGVAQATIKAQLFDDQAQSDVELQTIGSEIAAQCRCFYNPGPLKKQERAAEKITGPEGSGDWYDAKDLVRLTIVAPTPNLIKTVKDAIEKRFVASVGLGIVSSDQKFAHTDPCGYSDLNIKVRLSNGRTGEIQVNVPGIIYAKEKEGVSADVLGSKFNEIKCRYGIEGGRGHTLFEIYRKAKASENGKFAARVSKLYYAYFRGFFNPQLLMQLKKELSAFASKNPGCFHH